MIDVMDNPCYRLLKILGEHRCVDNLPQVHLIPREDRRNRLHHIHERICEINELLRWHGVKSRVRGVRRRMLVEEREALELEAAPMATSLFCSRY